jgi:hypothetical protein
MNEPASPDEFEHLDNRIHHCRTGANFGVDENGELTTGTWGLSEPRERDFILAGARTKLQQVMRQGPTNVGPFRFGRA